MSRSPLPSRTLAVLALVPAFLGGATEPWTQGVILCLLGVALCVAPPGKSPGKILDGFLVAICLCAFLAFLPAKWFGLAPWRKIASEEYCLDLGPCLSPQPWLSVQSCLLLLGGLSWLYLMCAGRSEFNRREMLRWFGAGLVGWAILANVLYWAQIKWPAGNSELSIFGSFPNRNQTANLLALGLVLVVALAHEEFRRHRRKWIAWLGGACVLFGSLVNTGSRAGILLGILGVATWALLVASKRGSMAQVGSMIGLLCGVIGLFLTFGGNALERMENPMKWAESSEGSLRWSIQKEALANTSAVAGVGLGNFQSVFLVSGQGLDVAKKFTVVHPESDWIWCAVEMGWVAVAFIFAGIGLLIYRMFPFGADPDWRLRAAGAAATLVFVLHGFVDVSGHRLGTVFPAIFLGACALTSASFASKPANYLPRIFRGLGVILVIVGAAWVIAATAGWELPGKIGAGVALEKAQELNTTGHYGESAKEAERALKWAPLDWRLHYQRAVSEISGQGSVRIALDHFRLARFLNPANVELPLKEGEVWMERNPALALPAWEEALSRAGERRKELYAEMLAKSQKASPRLAKAVETLAEGDTTLMCVALLASGTDGFGNRLNQLLANDPFLSSLSGEEQKALFRSWRSLGQGGEFLQQMQSHPEWMKIGWASAANLLASKGQFQRAYELAQSFVKAPALPETTLVDEPVRELRQAILSNPQSYLKGYALYVRQIRAGQEKEALVSLQRITSTKNCPNYFWFLQARLLAKVGDFKEAWGALSRSGLTAP